MAGLLCVDASARQMGTKKVRTEEYFFALSMYRMYRLINQIFCYQGSIIPSAELFLRSGRCCTIQFPIVATSAL